MAKAEWALVGTLRITLERKNGDKPYNGDSREGATFNDVLELIGMAPDKMTLVFQVRRDAVVGDRAAALALEVLLWLWDKGLLPDEPTGESVTLYEPPAEQKQPRIGHRL